MKEVVLPGEKLLAPIQLDIKQHTNKTLSDLKQLLQTGSTLKGTILEISKKGDVIFTTTIWQIYPPSNT